MEEVLWTPKEAAVQISAPKVQDKNPKPIEVFAKFVKYAVKSDDNIHVDFEYNMFGYEVITYMTAEDLDCIISMTEVTQNCITLYMRYVTVVYCFDLSQLIEHSLDQTFNYTYGIECV